MVFIALQICTYADIWLYAKIFARYKTSITIELLMISVYFYFILAFCFEKFWKCFVLF